MGKASKLSVCSYTKRDWWGAGAVAAFATWNGLAFRMVNAPAVSLPWSFLSFPRRDETWLAALATVLAVALIIGLTTRDRMQRGGTVPAFSAKTPLVAAAICMVLGSASIMGEFASVAPVLACGILCGAGMAIALCIWVRIVAVGDTSLAPQRLILGFAIAFALDVIAGTLPSTAAHALVSLLPLAWCGCLLALSRQLANTLSAQEAPARSFANTLTLCVAIFGFAVFMGILGFDYDAIDAQRVRFVQASIMAGGAALATLVLTLLNRLSDIERIQIAVPLILTTAFVLLPISTASILREFAVALAQSTLLLTFVIALFSAREGEGVARFPFLLATLAALNLLGVFIGGVIRNTFGLDATALTFTALLVVYFVLLMILPLSRRRQKVEYVITGASIVSPAEIAQIRCQALAERYPELSAREKDVLLLMLQNYSNARMAETLVVSESTVKTHVRHVYAKMGISSRQQLLTEAESIPLSTAD